MVELIFEMLGLAVDEVSIIVKTVLRWLIYSSLIVLVLFAIGWLIESPGLLKVSAVLLLVLITAVATVVELAVAIAKLPLAGTSAVTQGLKSLSGLTFWLASLALLFVLIPIGDQLWAIPLILLLSLILALGWARWGIGLSPEWATFRAYAILVAVIFILVVPGLRTVSITALKTLEERLVSLASKPNEIPFDASSIDQIPLYDMVEDKPIVWWGRDEQGKYHLYNGPGFNPFVRGRLQEPTPDLKQKIKEWLKQQVTASPQPAPPAEIPHQPPVVADIQLPVEVKKITPPEPTEIQPIINRYTLDPRQRNQWPAIPVLANKEYEITVEGQICWSRSDPEGCVTADGASWTPLAVKNPLADKYPAAEERFLALLGSFNQGPVFRIGRRTKLAFEKEGELQLVINLSVDSPLTLWENLVVNVKEVAR